MIGAAVAYRLSYLSIFILPSVPAVFVFLSVLAFILGSHSLRLLCVLMHIPLISSCYVGQFLRDLSYISTIHMYFIRPLYHCSQYPPVSPSSSCENVEQSS